ncbi:MAG: hypothetical protein ABIH57_01245 [Candidatus Omnitrophota bacterium]
MNINLLRKEFEKILAVEEDAKNLYDRYIDQIADVDIKNKLISIRDDEIAHIRMAKQLIDVVS